MEMVQRAHEEPLEDAIVPTRRHVIELAIPVFFLVQCVDQKWINCMQETLSQGTILRRWDYFWANGLRKVLVEHLSPSSWSGNNQGVHCQTWQSW
jgi:hypothetical protein